jgi:hypothetical protein
MKRNVLKFAGTAAAVAVFAAWSIVGTRAQSKSTPSTSALSTNWLGSVVIGKEETADRIARGAYPKADTRYELGLRSDGVVVWRKTAKSD